MIELKLSAETVTELYAQMRDVINDPTLVQPVVRVAVIDPVVEPVVDVDPVAAVVGPAAVTTCVDPISAIQPITASAYVEPIAATVTAVEPVADIVPLEQIATIEPAPVITAPEPDLIEPMTSVLPITDTAGYPWDPRIHGGKRNLNVDGTWKLKRQPKTLFLVKADWDVYVEQIRAELKIATSSQVADMTAAVNAGFGNSAIPSANPTPVVTQPTPVATTDPVDTTPVNFQNLMTLITSNNHVITVQIALNALETVVTAAVGNDQHGIHDLPALNNIRPDLIPAVYAKINEVVQNAS